jgi:redox-sensing transcriptional repressor
MIATRLPDKTIERLSQYRRVLLAYLNQGKQHIFSHELAAMLHITPVQVRRDIMLIAHTGTLRRGYDVRELINMISRIIDIDQGLKVIVMGVGLLGSAIINYFTGKRSKLTIAGAFDIDPEKVNRVYVGVPCYPADKLREIIKIEDIDIAILTVPPSEAVATTEKLVMAGIKGILNYTSTPVNVPPHVYLEEYDMITSLEKVAYFVKKQKTK